MWYRVGCEMGEDGVGMWYRAGRQMCEDTVGLRDSSAPVRAEERVCGIVLDVTREKIG